MNIPISILLIVFCTFFWAYLSRQIRRDKENGIADSFGLRLKENVVFITAPFTCVATLFLLVSAYFSYQNLDTATLSELSLLESKLANFKEIISNYKPSSLVSILIVLTILFIELLAIRFFNYLGKENNRKLIIIFASFLYLLDKYKKVLKVIIITLVFASSVTFLGENSLNLYSEKIELKVAINLLEHSENLDQVKAISTERVINQVLYLLNQNLDFEPSIFTFNDQIFESDNHSWLEKYRRLKAKTGLKYNFFQTLEIMETDTARQNKKLAELLNSSQKAVTRVLSFDTENLRKINAAKYDSQLTDLLEDIKLRRGSYLANINSNYNRDIELEINNFRKKHSSENEFFITSSGKKILPSILNEVISRKNTPVINELLAELPVVGLVVDVLYKTINDSLKKKIDEISEKILQDLYRKQISSLAEGFEKYEFSEVKIGPVILSEYNAKLADVSHALTKRIQELSEEFDLYLNRVREADEKEKRVTERFQKETKKSIDRFLTGHGFLLTDPYKFYLMVKFTAEFTSEQMASLKSNEFFELGEVGREIHTELFLANEELNSSIRFYNDFFIDPESNFSIDESQNSQEIRRRFGQFLDRLNGINDQKKQRLVLENIQETVDSTLLLHDKITSLNDIYSEYVGPNTSKIYFPFSMNYRANSTYRDFEKLEENYFRVRELSLEFFLYRSNANFRLRLESNRNMMKLDSQMREKWRKKAEAKRGKMGKK